METPDSNSMNKTDDVVAYNASSEAENSQPEENSGNWNWDFGSNDAVEVIDENLIIGNNQSIMSDGTTYEEFTSQARNDIFNKVDSVFDKLREKFPLDKTDSNSDKENPFANGNNPFGEGEFPLPPGYSESSQDENSSEEAQVNDNTSGNNPFGGGAGGENNPFGSGAGGGNPVAGGENPFAGGEGMSEQSSFDVSSFMFGDNLSFMNGDTEGGTGNSGMPSSSSSETLRKVYDTLTRFASDTTYPGFANGNQSPLKTSDDLLTLFRNDMFTNNNSGNSFEQLMDEDSPLSADGKMAENMDIIEAAMDGLLPFNGTENVFNTPEGEIPIGNGNIDDGSDNAVIGNANRDYGDFNATIGNGNWNWDGATKNSTVGNGNWHLDFSDNNNTLGNGNWHWEDSDNNSTLGNGNWAFGDNNSTIGNGNFNFGNNNTVIGNGNWVYTDNSIVIGNGNWSVVIDKSADGADEFLDDFNATMDYGVGIKNATDSLVDGLIGKMAGMLMPLTEDLGDSAMNTYNELFS
ncbi:MAG: hypothetical protein AAF630_13435 [Cyanobacteria bacterium P01_C01_bin.38]